jgi:hypothetical protein
MQKYRAKMILSPTTFKAAERECDVELTIDVERIMRYMGAKALLNVSKRSKEIDGLVVVKVKPL